MGQQRSKRVTDASEQLVNVTDTMVKGDQERAKDTMLTAEVHAYEQHFAPDIPHIFLQVAPVVLPR